MKTWFSSILALVAILALPLGLKAQSGPVLSAEISEIAVNAVDYSVAKITVTNGGNNYSANTKVTISGGGGTGATATPTIVGGVITGITVTSTGAGYLSTPTVVISDTSGTGATATLTLGYSVSKIQLLGGGANYTSEPTVTLNTVDGYGMGATAKAYLDQAGSIKEIVITNGGGGYISAPAITITGGGGQGASAIASFGYSVVAIGITQNDKNNYLSAPTVTLTNAPGDVSGSGASAKVTIDETSGKITGITVVTAGSGYTKPPIVTVNNDGVITVPGGGYTDGGGAIRASSAIGSIFLPPYQNEAFGPAESYIVISALAKGTFPASGYTYNYFVNGVSIGKALPVPILEPARVGWTPPEPGVYYIHVEVTDGLGNTAKSLAVRYFSTGTSIQSPLDNTLVPRGSSVVLQASAVGRPQRPNAFVQRIEFWADGVLIGTDYNYPYSTIYKPSETALDHTVEAKAFDNNGNQVSPNGTAIINLHMVNPEITPLPEVAIISPQNNSSVGIDKVITSGVTVDVNATSQSNQIGKVELYVDGVLTGTTSSYPYKFAWKPSIAGTYRLVALAYDGKNNVVASSTDNSNTSVPTPTVVTIGTPPSVSIDSPTTGTAVTEGDRVQISAAAYVSGYDSQSNPITIARVAFYVDGTYVGMDEVPTVVQQSPLSVRYTTTFTPSQKIDPESKAPIPSQIIAIVYDSIGLSGTSVPVSLTVNKGASGGGGGGTVIVGTPPTISVTSPIASSTHRVNTPLTISASANDSDGKIESVIFFVDGVAIGAADSIYPYSTTWTPTALGTYVITARTVDSDANAVTSTGISVTVADLSGTAPTVAITQPVESTALVNQTTTLFAEASDTDGSIASVQFFVDGQPLGAAVTAYPFTSTWIPKSPGTYAITALATDNGGQQTLSAVRTMTVSGNTPPTVNIISPATTVDIYELTSVTVSARAADSDGTVSSVAFYANDALIGTSTTADGFGVYSLTWTPPAAGSYNLIARATDNKGVTTDSVRTVSVKANPAPQVTLTAPVSDGLYFTGSHVSLTATASDSNGQATSTGTNGQTTTVDIPGVIRSVEFLVNGNVVDTDTLAPYSTNAWVPATAGTYTLTARATDDRGASSTSLPVIITVRSNLKPVASVTAPISGSSLRVNTPVTITANASDPDGNIKSVAFYVDGVLLSTDTVFPYSASWTPTSPGTYKIRVIATDNNDRASGELIDVAEAGSEVSVIVSDPTANAPVVAISQPLASSVLLGVPVDIAATATDADGYIKSVQFYLNGVALDAADTTYPYVITWNPSSVGTYYLTAVATDDLGNQTLSASRQVTVTTTVNQSPTVNVTSPVNAGTLKVNTATTIRATAADADGNVDKVAFFVNGVQLGLEDTVYPYSMAWTPTNPGHYSIVARATDNLGASTNSTPVSVTVADPSAGAPVVSISKPIASTGVAGLEMTLLAAATDPDGNIKSVEFFVDGAPLTVPITAYPYSATWTPSSGGTYIVVARATDNLGNQTDSEARVFTIIANIAPVVKLTAPSSSMTGLYQRTPIVMKADASDLDGTVVSVAFYAGDVLVSTATSAPYTATWRPDLPGTYELKAVATDNMGVSKASDIVTVEVKENPAPVVSITKPFTVEEKVGYTGSPFVLEATASDSSGTSVSADGKTAVEVPGTVTKVEFYANDVLVATDETAPYSSIQWIPTVAGTYNIVAKATDAYGAVGVSSPVVVVINSNVLPTVRVTSPLAGGSLKVNTPTTITSVASDVDGSIASVAFYLNDVVVGTDMVYPYSQPWTPSSPGTYRIKTRATDNNGAWVDSAVVTVTVADPAAGAPVVSITQPLGNTATVGATVDLVASATDSDGSIASVQFYVDGKELGGLLTKYPYTVAWVPASVGSYVLTARAIDNVGNVTDSTSRVITVSAGSSPSVALVAPSDNASAAAGSTVRILANASDIDGRITQVRILVNGQAVSTLTTAPYEYYWSPVSSGSYVLTAEATDDSGNITTSSSRTFTVRANQLPTITLTEPGTNVIVKAGVALTLKATAADNDGSVAKVEFLVDDIVVGSSSSVPYQITWTPQSAGVYRITALATDNAEAVTSSRVVYVKATDQGLNTKESIYTGLYQGATETGKFAFINSQGRGATFISYSDLGAKVRRFAGMLIDGNGAFSSSSGSSVLLSGNANDTGLSGSLAITGGTAPYIGILKLAPGTVPPGLYTGSVVGRATTEITAIVSQDGEITAAVVDGSFSDAGRSVVDVAGNFSISMVGGSKLIGKLDLVTGFVTATLTGTASGTVLGSNSSAVVINDGSLRNLSARGVVAPGKPIAVGFVIGGTSPKPVLIRAVGPKLTSYGVPSGSVQPDPKIVVHNISGSSPVQVALNDNWTNSSDVLAASSAVGAFALDVGSKDAVVLVTLAPGNYTAQVTAAGTASGVTLVELYDVEAVQPFAPQKLLNISANAEVGTGANTLHAGFVISGDTPKKVLIRAVGPTLSGYGVTSFLADPVIILRRLVNGAWVDVRENDNSAVGNDAALVSNAISATGAGLRIVATDTKSSELLVSLPPGTYTAEVKSGTGVAGTALVEVYEVP